AAAGRCRLDADQTAAGQHVIGSRSVDAMREGPVEELRRHYLFAPLTEAQWARIVPHTRVRAFAAGQHLFGQGDTAREFFLLRDGVVKLYRVSAEGQEKIMRLIRPGMTWAE